MRSVGESSACSLASGGTGVELSRQTRGAALEAFEYPSFCNGTFCDDHLTAERLYTDRVFQKRDVASCLPGHKPTTVSPCERGSGPQPTLGMEEDMDIRSGRSLSTSAGCPSVGWESDSADSPRSADKQPCQQIPTEPMYVNVRNTFVDYPVGRPLSLDEFFKEREVRSCPASRVGAPGSGVQSTHEGEACVADTASGQALAAFSGATASFAAAVSQWVGSVTKSGGDEVGKGAEGSDLTATSGIPRTLREPAVLRLADSISGPELGSPGQPTVGSASHHLGTCKPCAFLYTKGCDNGSACLFCHLCPPGEKKKRQKGKKVARQTHRQWGGSWGNSLQMGWPSK